jgi:hypothetical protein
MPFIYKPSLWGLSAAAIFSVLTALALKDTYWLEATMWGLLAVSFIAKYMPKMIVFGPSAAVLSVATLIAGGAMFISDAAERF